MHEHVHGTGADAARTGELKCEGLLTRESNSESLFAIRSRDFAADKARHKTGVVTLPGNNRSAA